MGDFLLMAFKKPKFITIIPARGGSKGIKKKNLIKVCNKPLLYWSIIRSLKSKTISSTWVTSEDREILEFSSNLGAKTVIRPKKLSGDFASSESAWLHAIDEISKTEHFDNVVGLQATSPIREFEDIDNSVKFFLKNKFDSLFSACEVTDHLLWRKHKNKYEPIAYPGGERKPRQKIQKKYLENGSIYIFNKKKFNFYKKRLFEKIGIFQMLNYKSIQIDEFEDIKFCESIMKNYHLNK